jgi:hypothetical protein
MSKLPCSALPDYIFAALCGIFCFATIPNCESGHVVATISKQKGEGMAKKPHLCQQASALIALNTIWLR